MYVAIACIQPLSRTELEEMAIEAVGLGTWQESSQAQRDAFITDKVWLKPTGAYFATADDQDAGATGKEGARPEFTKALKKSLKTKKNQ